MTDRIYKSRVIWGRPSLNGGFVTNPELVAAVANRAPSNASFITRTAESGLSAEFALSSIGPGILAVGDHNGALGLAGAGDLPAHTHTVAGSLVVTIGDGSGVIPTGGKGYIRMPFSGTWTDWVITGEQVSGLIQVDVWKDTYANYPPTVADTIAGTDKPRIASTGNKNASSLLTGWTKPFSAGDFIGINVDSVTAMTLVKLYLNYTRVIG